MDRILDISQTKSKLSISGDLLVIESPLRTDRIPVEDLLVVLVSAREVIYTHAVLAKLAQSNVAFIACDEKHMPVGILFPFDTHVTQAEKYRQQVTLSLEVKQELWKEVIRAKISLQALHLKVQHKKFEVLLQKKEELHGDNILLIEASAARYYWSQLFGSSFKRESLSFTQNALLNYGYAVVRATMARHLCTAGWHPTFGIFHHNRYNPYALADDLMEPFRIYVDFMVYQLMERELLELNSKTKEKLISVVLRKYLYGNCTQTLSFSMTKNIQLYSQAIEKNSSEHFKIPPMLLEPGIFEDEEDGIIEP